MKVRSVARYSRSLVFHLKRRESCLAGRAGLGELGGCLTCIERWVGVQQALLGRRLLSLQTWSRHGLGDTVWTSGVAAGTVQRVVGCLVG